MAIQGEIVKEALAKFPDATLLTTGPLNNIGELLTKTDVKIAGSVSMAGYWPPPGEPRSLPEFNFNGCAWAARAFVKSTVVGRRLLVGKNVTHQVFYDDEIHEQLREAAKVSRPLALARELMSLRASRSQMKKLHDPLAASAVIREDLFDWLSRGESK